MDGMNDAELLAELAKRFRDTSKALHDMRVMNEKIEKLNIKLAESEKLKSNFLSNIRNEINNPLTAILNMAGQLALPQKDEQSRQLMARMIHDEAFDLDFQLRNIFMAAEIEAGEAAVVRAQVDVASLVSRVIASFQQKAREKGVAVDFARSGDQIGEASLLFPTDPEKLRLVVANLLANAIEHSPAGSRVRTEAGRSSGSLRLSVADEGMGIPEGDRERLFERFHQLDQGTTKRHRGHGLGLSITKAIVELLGGKVMVSQPESGGSLFLVVVPEAPGGGSDVFSGDGNEFLFEGGNAF